MADPIQPAESGGMFELADLLIRLRQDLLRASRDEATRDLQFSVEDIDLELQLVAARDAKAGGAVKWWVVEANAGGSISSATTQKLRLKLRAIDPTSRETFKAGGEGYSPIRKPPPSDK
ncbi:MAG: trypco2 family protein [Geminicoccaceae bacterium]